MCVCVSVRPRVSSFSGGSGYHTARSSSRSVGAGSGKRLLKKVRTEGSTRIIHVVIEIEHPVVPLGIALRLASAKLPGPTEFISTSTPPRLGNIADVNAMPLVSRLAPLATSGSTTVGHNTPTAPASLLSSGARPASTSIGSVQAAVNAVRTKSTLAGAVRQDPMTGEVISLPDLDVGPRARAIPHTHVRSH